MAKRPAAPEPRAWWGCACAEPGQGIRLEAHPPLLLRVASPSRWGDHGYQPVLVRQGRHLTREHRLVLALWGRLLAAEQQAAVPEALVLAGPAGSSSASRSASGRGSSTSWRRCCPAWPGSWRRAASGHRW